jgi:hypothetical protein
MTNFCTLVDFADALLGRIHVIMNNKEIIFFDELGFGWVVDKDIMKKIHAASIKDELIVEKTLADLLKRGKYI